MKNFNDGLKKQLQEIDSLISQTGNSLTKRDDLSTRGVLTSKSNGIDQYLWVDKNTRKRSYARTGETNDLRKVLQRDYEILVNRKLQQLKKSLERFLRQYDITEIEKIYNKMAESKKKLVVPVIEPEGSFLENWRSIPYEPMPIDSDTGFYSGNGVRVRSKSELMIADMLEKEGIPYRYEYPMHLKSIGNIRPDFLCLNVRTRTEFIWEHFGMMDNIAYANKNIAKIQAYEQDGFFPGKNLMMTFETSQYSISSIIIKKMIEEYLC